MRTVRVDSEVEQYRQAVHVDSTSEQYKLTVNIGIVVHADTTSGHEKQKVLAGSSCRQYM